MMTYRELIKSGEKKAQEKEAIWYLVTELTSLSRTEILLKMEEPIPEKWIALLRDAVDRYCEKNIPVQYIVGHTYFYGLKLFVAPTVLIPRFETEELVEKTMILGEKQSHQSIVDVGCGSGCIAIALQKKWPAAQIDAIDISPEALDIAKKNADFHHCPIRFMQNDLLTGIYRKYDIIISNPPYIDPQEEVDQLVKNNEPNLALFSGNHGLDHYSRLIPQAKSCLKPNGFLALEIASNKRMEIEEIGRKYFTDITCYFDLQQKARILIMR